MPNIKSSAKRDSIAKARNAQNKAKRTALKTTIKKFDSAVSAGNSAEAQAAYAEAVKTIDKASVHGLIHRNNAARKKSRLTLSLNRMKASV